MSHNICTLKQKESNIIVTSFWGGSKSGKCYQLTRIKKDGTLMTYIQLSVKDLYKINKAIERDNI